MPNKLSLAEQAFAQQQMMFHLRAYCEWAEYAGIKDPLSYNRAREIQLACTLGHNVANDYSGADAYEEDGTPTEYKSTIGPAINATYNGISVQPTWEQQEAYMINDKIGCYPRHYYARHEGAKIAEVWRMEADTVLGLLLPRARKQYVTKQYSKVKDPRIGLTLSAGVIRKHGTRIL